MKKLIAGALHVSAVTGGAFDITWQPLGDLWAAAAGRDQRPTPSDLEEVLRLVGWKHVKIQDDRIRFDRAGVRLGINGVAKGWIIDAVFRLLRRAGYEHVVVNIGGDLRTSGRDRTGKPRLFRIADPTGFLDEACQFEIEDVAVATSGNNIRFRTVDGTPQGHILDPRTGRPPAFGGSVTVITRDATMADALATALFVAGPAEGLAFARRTPGVDVVYVSEAGVKSTLDLSR